MIKRLLITLCFVLTLFSVNFAFASNGYLDIPNWETSWNTVNYTNDRYQAQNITEFGSYPNGITAISSDGTKNGAIANYFNQTLNIQAQMDGRDTGTWYLIVYSNYSDGTIGYLNTFYWNSTTKAITPEILIPPNYTSRIDNISVSTTTGKVNITGYWNTSTSTGVFQQLEFYQDSSLLGIESYTTINATTSGIFDLNFDYRDAITPYTGTTTASITSSIMFYANLYQKDNNYYDPFGELDYRYSTLLDATSTSLTASTTNAWELSTTTSILDYPEYECAITSITGCFKNAGIWLFYPSSDSMEKYNSFIELIQRKPPVGYFTIVKTSISGLSATSTSAFSITIPNSLKQYFFAPLDAGIAGILWIYFLFMFYKRLKHIQL